MNKNINFFQKGLEFFKSNDLKKALLCFLKDIEKNPFHLISYFLIGKIHFINKNYIDAYEYFQICYNNEKDNIFYNLYLGRSLIFLKDYAGAVPYLLYYQKSRVEGNFFLGIAFYNLNEFEKAVIHFENCPDFFHNKHTFVYFYSLSLFNLGNVNYANEDIKKAKELFYLSIDVNKNLYPSYFQLGSIFMFEGNYEQAVLYYEFLYERYKNESIRISLLFIYTQLGDFEKLEKVLTEIDSENSFRNLKRNQFKKILALTLFKRKKYKEAVPLFIQLHKDSPDDKNILHYLLKCRYITNETAKCYKIFEKIFKITFQDIKINNFYLLFLIREKRYIDAFKKADFFLGNYIYDNKTELYFFYAGVFSNNKFDFERYFLKLKNIYENNEMFLEAAGFYYFNKKAFEKSLLYYHKIYKQSPDDSETILKLIEIYQEKKYSDKVLILMKNLYDNNPTNHNAAFYYSYELIKESRYNDALEVLKKIETDRNKVYLLVSNVFFLMNNSKYGFIFLKRSFLLNPLYLPVLYKSLVYFFKNANYLQAIRICKLMEYSNPAFKRRLIYEALIYMKKSRYDLAIPKLEKFISEVKDSPYVKYLLSCAYYNDGKINETKKILLHLIKIRKEQAPYLALLALCYKLEYKISEQTTLENKLKKQFGNTSTYQEYNSKYLDIYNKNTYHKNNIGIGLP